MCVSVLLGVGENEQVPIWTEWVEKQKQSSQEA